MKQRRQNSKKAVNAVSQLDLFSVRVPASPVVVATEQRTDHPKPCDAVATTEQQRNPIDPHLISFVTREEKRGRRPKPLLEDRPISDDAGRLLDVREAARRLGLSKSTLDKMRCSGRGPRFIRATDRAVRYDPEDLRAFADERRRRSTSQLIEALNA
jgi:predicted DNA-binding transcriptional regulator AlpA